MAAALRSIAACLLLALCLPAQAAALLVYRCVDATGAVALQDRPCPPGQEQERSERRRPLDGVAPAPPPAPVATPAESGSDATAAAADAAVAAPSPPALWDCVRHDGERYESDTGVAPQYWVPLWVLGRDPRAPPSLFGSPGAPRPPPPASGPEAPTLPAATGLALTPGAWVQDRCRLLSVAETCARLSARRDALRREWRLAMPSGRAQIQPQERALSQTLRVSCGR